MKNLISILLLCLLWQNTFAQNDTIIKSLDENTLLEKSPKEDLELEVIIDPSDLREVIVTIFGCHFRSLQEDCSIPFDTIISEPDSSYGLASLRAIKNDFKKDDLWEGKYLQISLFRLTRMPLDYNIEVVGFFLVDKTFTEKTRVCFVETQEGIFIKRSSEDFDVVEDKELPKKAVEFMLKQLRRRE